MHRRFSLTAIVMVLFIVLLAVSCGEDPFFYDLVVRNGDEVITSAVLYVGDEYTLPSSPDMRGRVFDGWAVNGDKSDLKAPGERIRITGSTTVDAVWGEIIDKPDVSSVDTSTVYRAGDTISLTAPEGTTLRWTVDGTEPSATNGTEGTEVSLSGTAGLVSVKVAAVKNGGCSETESFVVKVEPSISFDRSKAETVSPDDTVKVSVPSGVSVYYTTDGSTPTASGTKYDSTTGIPLGDVRGKTTIRVLAVKDGVESTSELTLNVVSAAPDLDVDTTATYSQGDSVTLTVPEGSTIRYTTDGTDPTATTGTVYKDGISLEGLSGNVNIKAVVVKDGEASAVKDITLKVQPTAPTYSASASKTYDSTEFILFDNLPANTTIHYTTDGTDPTAASRSESDGKSIFLSGLSGKETVKYVAVKDGIASEVKTIEVSVKPAVSFDKAASSNLGQDDSVKITVPENTAVYYTTDGSIPTLSSTKYDSTDGISLKNELGNTTIKVLAVKDGVESTSELSVHVAFPSPTVEADTSTTYTQSDKIKVEVPAGGKVRYTINSSDPTVTTGTEYTSDGIPLSGYSGNVNIKAVIVKDGETSAVKDITVKVKPAAVTASSVDTTKAYTVNETINLTSQTGTILRYTTGNDTPTAESTAVSSGSIPLTNLAGEVKFNVVAEKDGIISDAASFTVKVKPTVSFDKAASANLSQNDSVKITVPENTAVYYTTDGSIPTLSSTKYDSTDGISLKNELGNTTIKVLAVKDNVSSDISSLTVLVKGTAPEVEDTETTYPRNGSVKLDVPEGAVAYYTINGDDPTDKSVKYDSETGIPLSGYSGDVTIKTVMYKDGVVCSEVGTKTVKVQPTAPDYTVSASAYSTTDKLTFTGLSDGTTIYYTTDGSVPTKDSKTESDGKSISLSGLSGKKTVKYVAVKDGVVSEVKTIDVSVKPDITFSSEEDAELKRSDSVKITVPGNTTVYYTTDGSTPTKSSSAYNTSGIPLENALGTTTIRVLAVTSDGVEATSDLRVKVEIPGPEITVDGNKSYAQGDKLTVTVPSGTTVRYTTDGTEPTATEGNVYDSSTGIPLTGLSGEATIKAVIVKGEEYSATATTVNVKVKPAVLTKPTLEAKYSEDGSIEFTALASGTSVRYTLDGTAVTSSSAVAEGNRISLAGTLGDADSKDVTVRAVAEKDGVISDEITFKVTVKKQSVLTLNLGGGKLSEGVPQTYSYVDSGTVTLPTSVQISKAGCSFDGWYTTSDATTTGYISTATYAATGNAEIYALWIPAGLNIDESGKVTSSIGVSGEIVIPAVYHGKAVTEIAGNAFYDSSAKKGADITKVTIPSSVTKIGKGAFQGCSSLTSADIKANITELSEGAFSGCESLSDVTLPDSLTTIGNSALKGTALTSVNLKNVTSIGNSAFEGCKSLSSITMDKVTVIGSSAFSNTALTSFTVPSGVTKIDSGVFANCSKLSSITFDGAITEIGDNAFQNCTGLTAVSVPDSVTALDAKAFAGCAGLSSVSIGSGITTIASDTFLNCESLTAINIKKSSGSASFASDAPWGASSSATVSWKKSVKITYYKNKGPDSFEVTYDEDTIKLSEAITNSDYYMDGWYTDMAAEGTYYAPGASIAAPSDDISLYAHWIDEKVDFSKNTDGTYAAKAKGTVAGNVVIPRIYMGKSVTEIADAGFLSSYATNVTIPYSVKKIGTNAFWGSPVLSTVSFETDSLGKSNLTTIGGAAFAACGELTAITLPVGVKTIENLAFSTCPKLTTVNIPSTITSVAANAFEQPTGTGVTSYNFTILNVGVSSTSTVGNSWYSKLSLYWGATTKTPTVNWNTYSSK